MGLRQESKTALNVQKTRLELTKTFGTRSDLKTGLDLGYFNVLKNSSLIESDQELKTVRLTVAEILPQETSLCGLESLVEVSQSLHC